MATLPAAMGSLGVIELYLGGSIGSDITPDSLCRLSRSQRVELADRLNEANLRDVPDLERAARWIGSAAPPSHARVAISELWSQARAAVPLSLYVDHIVCEDPMKFAHADDRILTLQMDRLADVAPLVRDGHVSLSPPRIGWAVSFEDKEAEAFVGHVGAQLPWLGYQNEDTILMAGELYIAGLFGLVPIAVASRPGLLDPLVLGSSRSATVQARLGQLVLPSFSEITGAKAAELRRNSGALAEVRLVLDEIERELPSDAVLPDEVAAMTDDIVRPAAEVLARQVKRTPSLEAVVGFGIAIGIGITRALGAGLDAVAAASLATAPVPPLLSMIRNRHAGKTEKLATRLLLEMTPAGIDPRCFDEDNRRDRLGWMAGGLPGRDRHF